MPDAPAAWLYRVVRHAAIDALRVHGRHDPLPEDDDELALLAPLLFTTEAALAQRLARARQQLAGQRLQVPAGHELPARREAVLTTLALMFHQGRLASGRQGGAPAAVEAMAPCWEAIRLARAVAAHPASADADADAMAALLLLHGARLTGRIDAHGDIVPLAGQPRDRWDAGMQDLGFAHLRASQRGTRLSRWHLQAGIAGEHALAVCPAATDWPAIVRYYELLVTLDPSAAPRLGHAIARAEGAPPIRRWTGCKPCCRRCRWPCRRTRWRRWRGPANGRAVPMRQRPGEPRPSRPRPTRPMPGGWRVKPGVESG